MSIKITEKETDYILKLPYDQKDRAKSIQGYRWDPELKCWHYPRTARNYDALIAEFGDDLFSPGITRPTPKVEKDDETRLREELKRVKYELAKKNELLESLTKAKDLSRSSLESENQTLKIALSTLEEEINNYRKKMTEIEHDKTKLQNELQESKKEIIRLQHTPAGLDRQLKDIAKRATGNDRYFSNFIDKLSLDSSALIEIAKHLEDTLRTLLRSTDRHLKLHDLITQAKDAQLLENEAIQLAHLIRVHRNIMAHEKVDIRTHQARLMLVFFSAALLWPLLPE